MKRLAIILPSVALDSPLMHHALGFAFYGTVQRIKP